MTSTHGAPDAAQPAPGPPVPPPATTRLTARSPEDLLAVVPVVLGFVPEESVVMLTFGAGRTFHARVDLPRAPQERSAVVALLRGPAIDHGVTRVVFVLFTADALEAARTAEALVRGFTIVGIDVADVLRADGHRWHPLLRTRPGVDPRGVPYDVRAHRFAAQAVFEGRVTHGSRAELAASIEPCEERVAALSAALRPERARPRGAGGVDPAWARDLVRRHVAAGTVAGDEDLARLLLAVRRRRARRAVQALMTRRGAPGHVAFWSDVVRRAPDDVLATPAALLGFAAWLAGHGALAWCAVDRCLAAKPGHVLGEDVAGLLERAVPPHGWEEASTP